MGRNPHNWIMKAVPWIAVVVLGIFSISRLADRAPPAPLPADPPAATEPPPTEAASEADASHDALLALRDERRALRAQIASLQRDLAASRARTERAAAVGAAHAALPALYATQLERLTAELAAAQAKVAEQTPEPVSPAASWDAIASRVRAYDKAKGKARVDAAARLLEHEDAASLSKNEKLMASLFALVNGMSADPVRDQLTFSLVRIHDGVIPKALDTAVLLRPVVVSFLLHAEQEAARQSIASLLATHATTLDSELREDIAVAAARIVQRPAKHSASVNATAAQVLGLLRPEVLPVEALSILLDDKDVGTRTASAYALARARKALDARALRKPCLRLLASSDPRERRAAALLGERIFKDFAFNPLGTPQARAKAIAKLEAQAGS